MTVRIYSSSSICHPGRAKLNKNHHQDMEDNKEDLRRQWVIKGLHHKALQTNTKVLLRAISKDRLDHLGHHSLPKDLLKVHHNNKALQEACPQVLFHQTLLKFPHKEALLLQICKAHLPQIAQ